MRIALITGFGITPQKGGQGTFCAQLAIGLTRLGHEVLIITDDGPSWEGWISQAVSGALPRVASPLVRNLCYADVVHLNQPALRMLIGALFARKPVVVTHQDYRARCPSWTAYSSKGICLLKPTELGPCRNCPQRGWGAYYRLRFQAWLLSRAQNVGVSEHVKRRLNLHHAIWSPYDATKVPDLSRHPIEPRITFIGRLVPEKGPEIALQALKDLPGIHLDIFGDGPLKDYLKTEAFTLHLHDRVHFHGHQPYPVLSAQTASAVVVPSLWEEPFGYVTVETMAVGKAVIAAATGGSVELLADERGWLIPPGDPEALADVVRQVLANPLEAQRRGRRARNFVLTALNPVDIAKRYLNVYESAVQAAGKQVRV